MQPTQPSNADVNAVAAHLGQQPQAPQPQAPAPVAPQQPAPQFQPPAPQTPTAPYTPYTPGIQNAQPYPQVPNQPQAPAPQAQPPAPTADPFANMFPQAPAPQVTPVAPPTAPVATEVSATPPPAPPTSQPSPTSQQAQANAQQPQSPAAPQTPPAPRDPNQPMTFQDRIEDALSGLPEAPVVPELSKVDPDSPDAINQFFADYRDSIIQTVSAQNQRAEAIKNVEGQAWSEAFKEYPSLQANPQLRQTVQAIRMGNYEAYGIYQSPLDAAKALVDSMTAQYNQGIVDEQVHTTITATQPMNGGNQIPAPVTNSTQELLAVQDGGETALADILAGRINSGQL